MVISQREARRLRRRVDELERIEERRRNFWVREWSGGVEIQRAKWEPSDSVPIAIRTARKLSHAVIAIEDEAGLVRFIALPVGKC